MASYLGEYSSATLPTRSVTVHDRGGLDGYVVGEQLDFFPNVRVRSPSLSVVWLAAAATA